MARYWRAFARFAPFVPGQTFWPGYETGRMRSLRQDNASAPISDAEFSAGHNSSFWGSFVGWVVRSARAVPG